MATILTSDHKSTQEYSVNKMIDDLKNSVAAQADMTYVKLSHGVTGNKRGKIKTGGEQEAGKATGSSYASGFGSTYITGGITLPFEFKFGKDNMVVIMRHIAKIQQNLSEKLSELQGDLPAELEAGLRDSAMRSRAIREARREILENMDDIDQATFDAANKSIRAGVLTDMSCEAGIRSSFSIGGDSERALWAQSKGYKLDSEKNIWTYGADEKGLKKIYLLNDAMIRTAQEWVSDTAMQVEAFVNATLKDGWTSGKSLIILEKITEIYKGTGNGTKNIIEFSESEELQIMSYSQEIVKGYMNRLMS